MDTGETEKVVERPDISQLENWVANLAGWKREEARLFELLKHTLPEREKAAKELLAFADAHPRDHRDAEKVLADCASKRPRLEETLEDIRRANKSYEQRIAAVMPEYERQKERNKTLARMRGEL